MTLQEFIAELDTIASRHGWEWNRCPHSEWKEGDRELRHMAIRMIARSMEAAISQYREPEPAPSRTQRDHIEPTQAAAARLLARLRHPVMQRHLVNVLKDEEKEQLASLLNRVQLWQPLPDEEDEGDFGFENEHTETDPEILADIEAWNAANEAEIDEVIDTALGENFYKQLDDARADVERLEESKRTDPIRFGLVLSVVEICSDAFGLSKYFEEGGPIKRTALCEFATRILEITSMFEGVPKLDDGYVATRLTNEAIAVLIARARVTVMERALAACIDKASEEGRIG